MWCWTSFLVLWNLSYRTCTYRCKKWEGRYLEKFQVCFLGRRENFEDRFWSENSQLFPNIGAQICFHFIFNIQIINRVPYDRGWWTIFVASNFLLHLLNIKILLVRITSEKCYWRYFHFLDIFFLLFFRLIADGRYVCIAVDGCTRYLITEVNWESSHIYIYGMQ